MSTDLPSPQLCPPPALHANAALFLDLDGTVLDFAPRPAQVIVHADVLAAITRLHRALGGALAIVSGRALGQIDALTGLPGIAAAGLHGSELRDAAGAIRFAPAAANALDAARRVALELTATLEGVLVEDKVDAIALHYRRVPDAVAAVTTIADQLLRIAGSGFALQHGNHVIELRPRGHDKGTALGELMATAPFAGREPWMIGDDLTDEHAFAAANVLHGVSVIVGPRRPTSARHALADPTAVRRWLADSAAALQ